MNNNYCCEEHDDECGMAGRGYYHDAWCCRNCLDMNDEERKKYDQSLKADQE